MLSDKTLTVSRTSESGLIRERWVFSVQGWRLSLVRYHYERRWSLIQSSFRTLKLYDKERDLSEDYGSWQWLESEEIPWDETVRDELLDQIRDLFTVEAPELPQ